MDRQELFVGGDEATLGVVGGGQGAGEEVGLDGFEGGWFVAGLDELADLGLGGLEIGVGFGVGVEAEDGGGREGRDEGVGGSGFDDAGDVGGGASVELTGEVRRRGTASAGFNAIAQEGELAAVGFGDALARVAAAWLVAASFMNQRTQPVGSRTPRIRNRGTSQVERSWSTYFS